MLVFQMRNVDKTSTVLKQTIGSGQRLFQKAKSGHGTGGIAASCVS